MEYFVNAHDGGTRGYREVGRFQAKNDSEAKQIFDKKFKKNKKYYTDGLDLYRVNKNEMNGRQMIEYRWRLVTRPLIEKTNA